MRIERIVLGIACCAITFLSTMHVSAQEKNKQITVSGKVKFVPSAEHRAKYPFVLKEGPGKDAKVLDTIQVNGDGSYHINISSSAPRFYSMNVFGWDRITFWAGSDDLIIDFRGEDTAKVKIKNPPYVLIEGSEENEVVNMVNFVNYQTYQNMIYAGKLQYAAMQQKDTLWQKKATDLMMRQYEVASDYTEKIVRIYQNDPAVLYALQRLNWKNDAQRGLLLSTLDHLIGKYPWLSQAKERKQEILAQIEQSGKVALGALAPDFTYPNLKGKKVSLSDFRGKYVLVDFWASWCGPCRAESPNVKKAYEKYKDDGFEVLSVSIDTKEDEWRKAVEEDGLTWTQILAKNYQPLMKTYQFGGIPFIILLDREGHIIAKNLRGEELNKKLAEIFADDNS